MEWMILALIAEAKKMRVLSFYEVRKELKQIMTQCAG
jgi:hypothetical protein